MGTDTSVNYSNKSQIYKYVGNDPLSSVNNFNYDAVTNDGGRWVKVLAKTNDIVTINAGPTVLNGLFQQYGTGLVKYVINGEVYNYYKRLANKSIFNFYDNFAITWSNQSNVLNKDFKIYSTYSDLLSDSNAWQYCSYNQLNIAYPGNCGPTSSVLELWSGYVPNTQPSIPESTEIWIQVFSLSKSYATDVIVNGDFEFYSDTVNTYATPVDWQSLTNSTSNDLAVIYSPNGLTPTLNGSVLVNEKGSYCGIAHVLITKPVGKPFGSGIKQTVYVPSGHSLQLEVAARSTTLSVNVELYIDDYSFAKINTNIYWTRYIFEVPAKSYDRYAVIAFKEQSSSCTVNMACSLELDCIHAYLVAQSTSNSTSGTTRRLQSTNVPSKNPSKLNIYSNCQINVNSV